MWIAGTSSTSALTPNAQRSNLSPLSSTFLRRRRDRAETPGLIAGGFFILRRRLRKAARSFPPGYAFEKPGRTS
jgi:hypothetical protein